MTKKKIENLAAAYAAEMNLWDDPFEAPSVPGEAVLKEFVENEEAVEPCLADQIRKDLNCRRALDRVKFEKYGILSNENLISEEKFHKMLESVVTPETKLVLDETSVKRMDFPRKGDIFCTQGRLPVIDENGNMSFVYTFKPCAVLLLDDGETMPWNDNVFRCAVVTPDYAGNAVEGQDMDLGNGWILHKWLSYPVSCYQLDWHRKVGSVNNIDEIAEIVEEYSISDEEMTRYGKEEKRLMAAAGYLPVVADMNCTAFEMAEELEESEESLVERLKKWLSKFTAQWVEKLDIYTIPEVFAASDGDTSTVVVRKGDKTDAKSFTARLTDPIFLRKDTLEESLPEWSFDLSEDIPEGMVFVLRDAKGIGVGFGSVYHTEDHCVAQLIEYFPEKLEKDIVSANDVVLEVYVPW